MDIEPVLKRLEAVERQNGEFAVAIGGLRDAVVVIVEVQRRQGEAQRALAEGQQALADVQRRQAELVRYVAEVQQSIADGQAAHERTIRATNETIDRLRLTMAEFEDKLNGAIGYIENFFRRPPPEPPH